MIYRLRKVNNNPKALQKPHGGGRKQIFSEEVLDYASGHIQGSHCSLIAAINPQLGLFIMRSNLTVLM